MNETHVPDDLGALVPAASSPAMPPLPRWLAALQAFMVSGLPTQLIVLAAISLALGRPVIDGSGQAPLSVFAAVGLIDTLFVTALVLFFLVQSGESPAAVLVGTRPIGPDVRRGLLFVPVAFVGVSIVVLLLRTLVPSLHTVPTNPLVAYLDTPVKAALFFVVAILAGGVREELQRAFILHRFEQRLGGMKVGLAVFTALFALQHIDQGADVALAVGLLGLWWGLSYLRRRSVSFAMANHAGFNGLQVIQAIVAKAAGA